MDDPVSEDFNPSPQLRIVAAFLRRKNRDDSIIPPRTSQYDPKKYELLMLSRLEPQMMEIRGFPLGPVRHGEDPSKTVQRDMYRWGRRLQQENGLKLTGLLAKRAVFVSCHGNVEPGGSDDTDIEDKFVSLFYLLPISHESSKFVSKLQRPNVRPKFICLYDTLRKVVRNEVVATPATRSMLSALDKWLREQHGIPYAVQSLFLGGVQARLRMAVTNPLFTKQNPLANNSKDNDDDDEDCAYVDIDQVNQMGSTVSVASSKGRGLAVAKPLAVDRADLHFVNPLLTENMAYVPRVDIHVVNKHFGKGVPNYSKIELETKKNVWDIELPQDENAMDWVDEFPLHRAACEGTVVGVLARINEGYDANQPDSDSWTPLHYAAWYGHAPVVRALIVEGKAKLNVMNENGSTPLHLAASTGRPEVVQFLLKNPEIQKEARDRENRTPLALCEECKMNDWEVAAMLLKGEAVDLGHAYRVAGGAAASGAKGPAAVKARRYQALAEKKEKKLTVDFMDGSKKVLTLEKGNETSAKDAVDALAKEMNLSQECQASFGLWIKSPSLQWELSEDHNVNTHLHQWSQFVEQLTDSDPDEEPASIAYKKDCMVSRAQERRVKDPFAIELLFSEAQYLVLTSQYPSSEEDAIYLGGISMQVAYGNHNDAIHKPGFLRNSLDKFIPASLIKKRNAEDLEVSVLQEHAEMSKRDLDDVKLLHLLYLQYCWQWSYYGSTFFQGTIQPKTTFFQRRNQVTVRVGINMDGIHIINQNTNTLMLSVPHRALVWSADTTMGEFHMGSEDGTVEMTIKTRQTMLMDGLVKAMHHQLETDRRHAHVQKMINEMDVPVENSLSDSGLHPGGSGGKKETGMRIWDEQGRVLQEDFDAWNARNEQEQGARLEITRDFGEVHKGAERKFLAQLTFERFRKAGEDRVEIERFGDLCYELGLYVSETDIEGANILLGQQDFTFKHLVTWWSQCNRSWLFLLDDHALRQRERATKMYRKVETSPGFLGHSQIPALLDHMSSINGVKLPMADTLDCHHYLESLATATGKLNFNEYIDWLGVNDCLPDKAWSVCPPAILES